MSKLRELLKNRDPNLSDLLHGAADEIADLMDEFRAYNSSDCLGYEYVLDAVDALDKKLNGEVSK